MLTSFLKVKNASSVLKTAQKPAFYKVSDGDRTHYILGTVHCCPLAILPKFVIDTLKQSDCLLTESMVKLPDTLNFKIKEDEFNHFEAAIKEKLRSKRGLFWEACQATLGQLGAEKLDAHRFNPEILVDLYKMRAYPRMDDELIELFKGLGKPVIEMQDFALEYKDLLEKTRQMHTNVQKCISLADEVKAFMLTPRSQNVEVKNWMDIYTETDVSEHTIKLNALQKKEVVTQNRAWVEKFCEHAAQHSVSKACGFSHLYGPDGVLALLEQKGFSIKRLLHAEQVKTTSEQYDAPVEKLAKNMNLLSI